MPDVAFFTFLPPELAQRLAQYAPDGFDVGIHPIQMPDEEKIPIVRDADFLILFPGRISERVLTSARRLKLIQLVSAGFEGMDLDLCRKLGIPVANNGGSNAVDVAEHTIALMLAFYRRLAELDHNVRHDAWHAVQTGYTTYTIHGKTAGIVGLGHIGRRVARLLHAFGAQTVYYDSYRPSAQTEQELGVRFASLPDILSQSDIVTLHVPINEATRHMIGPEQLALMKPSALLVNTCRGGVIDETALTRALQEKRIMGAALDVFEQEPPSPDNPLLTLDNVLFTPHTAGVTYDTWARRGRFVFENLQRVWDGKPPLATVGK